MSVLTRVQLNPEITTDDSSFVTDLVTRAQSFVTSYCNLPRFPEAAPGYSKSGASAAEDLTGIASNTLCIYLNGSQRVDVAVTLANCTTGLLTAAELQAAIRAASDSDYGFDEVTVTFADGQYTLASGRYGEDSTVFISFFESTKHLARAMKLSPVFGGTEYPGSAVDLPIEDVTVQIVEQLYRKLGVEGLQQYSLHQGEFNGAAYAHLDPVVMSVLRSRRRLW